MVTLETRSRRGARIDDRRRSHTATSLSDVPGCGTQSALAATAPTERLWGSRAWSTEAPGKPRIGSPRTSSAVPGPGRLFARVGVGRAPPRSGLVQRTWRVGVS